MSWIKNNSLAIFGIALIILLLIFWWIGGVDSGLSTLKKMIASKEKTIETDLKKEIKTISGKVSTVEKKIKAKDNEIIVLKRDYERIVEDLDEVKKEREKVVASVPPGDVDALVTALRKSGFKSATVCKRPR